MTIFDPDDGWGVNKKGDPITPRRWQLECQSQFVSHFSNPKPENAVVRAIMGAGKALMIAQFCASCQMDKNECIVVSTSSIYLVEELFDTIQSRFSEGFFSTQMVGSYYTHGKDIYTPIIVTCMPSVPELSQKLAMHGRKVALWIGDECHRTETKTIKDAYEILTPARVCGCTATPFRSDKAESLSLFSKLLYDYGPGAALSDGGVIVPWEIIPYEGDEELPIDDAVYSMCKDSVGPGIINSRDIADAEDYAKYLSDRNFPAMAVHSKLSMKEIRSRLEDLKAQRLRAVVHCNMLQEGANFPWIRWMALRRQVSSRTRFCQEIGRGLRADPDNPDKTCCIYYDPWGLFSLFSLDYKAVLGGEFEKPVSKEDEEKEQERLLTQEAFDFMRELVEARAQKNAIPVPPLAGYLTTLINAFDVCGLIDRKISSRYWRSEKVSDRQLKTVTNLRWATEKRIVPTTHQRALGMLSECGEAMNKGMASDMIEIQMALAEKGAKWIDFKNLDRAAESGIEKQTRRRPVPKMGGAVKPPKIEMVQGQLFETKRTQ